MEYPRKICFDCGELLGKRMPEISTIYDAVCDLCGRFKPCTEPRDFGHLKENWEEITNPYAHNYNVGILKDDDGFYLYITKDNDVILESKRFITERELILYLMLEEGLEWSLP